MADQTGTTTDGLVFGKAVVVGAAVAVSDGKNLGDSLGPLDIDSFTVDEITIDSVEAAYLAPGSLPTDATVATARYRMLTHTSARYSGGLVIE